MATQEMLKDWLPLAGVALGWGLNQGGQWLVYRRDERKAIGCALSDLLEVRHRLLAIPYIVEGMKARLGLPAGAEVPLKAILGQLLPASESLAKRYEDSVALIAGCNPILAFRLRSKDLIGPYLHQLRMIALQDAQAGAVLGTIEEQVFRHLAPHLDTLIRELANRYGWRTQRKVSQRLREPLEIPEEFWQALQIAISQQPPAPSSEAGSP